MIQPGAFSLHQKTRQYFRRAIALFAAILLVMLFAMLNIARMLARDYLSLGLGQVGENLESYFNQIEKSAFSISSSTAYLNYYSIVDASQEPDAITSMYETANTLCNQVPSLLDVTVVSTAGQTNSYHSGYGYSLLPALRARGVFDANDTSRGFVFFPEDAEHASQFVYYFPILDFVVGSSPASQKTATAVFLFDSSTILDYLNASPESAAVYQLLFEGADVCHSARLDGGGPRGIRAELPLSKRGFTLAGAVPTAVSSTPVFWEYGALLLLLLFFVLGCLIAIERFVQRYINAPVAGLLRQLSGFDSISSHALLEPTGITEFDAIVDTTNGMIRALQDSSREILNSQNHLYEVELREKETELYALQSQLNPHFLYNTLECIRGLATIGHMEEIKTIVQDLSAFYRYSSLPEPFVTILDEVEMIYKYLNIYQIRTGGALTFDIDIEDELLGCDTVRMILQPIVENCIAHGLQATDGAPHIRILGAREGSDRILLRVIDNGSGMPYDKLAALRQQLQYTFNESLMRGNKHLGLYNINRRIKLLLGESYGLSVFSNPNGTEVDILLPLVSEHPLPPAGNP